MYIYILTPVRYSFILGMGVRWSMRWTRWWMLRGESCPGDGMFGVRYEVRNLKEKEGWRVHLERVQLILERGTIQCVILSTIDSRKGRKRGSQAINNGKYY